MESIEISKVEKAIQFYMLTNNLKYVTKDGRQSIADQIYGAMVLATAINSEYERTENLASTLKMILLSTLNEYYCEDFAIENDEFANECKRIEDMMEHFFEEFLREENIQIEKIDELYNIARVYGLTARLGYDESKNYEIFRFYYLNRVLKKKDRSGWDKTHWNVSIKRIEKISEHIVGTIALAMALSKEFDFNIDIDKVISVLCIHEVGEISIGDITPFDGITKEEKEKIEHQAIIEVIGNLVNRKDMIDSIFAFDKQGLDWTKFAHYCDKLECDIQAKVYQDMGYQNPLSEQQNNVVFKSDKVQKMLEDGATTAFDIWFEWDKTIYEEAPVFKRTLQYIKDTKLK